jgi:Cu+-exporting ATPase
MKTIIYLLFLLFFSQSSSAFSQSSEKLRNIQQKNSDSIVPKKNVYTCPVHSDVVKDKPGKCPKCGRDLVKKGNKDIYYCPHHPEVKQDKPGVCPKCGMDLVKKTAK